MMKSTSTLILLLMIYSFIHVARSQNTYATIKQCTLSTDGVQFTCTTSKANSQTPSDPQYVTGLLFRTGDASKTVTATIQRKDFVSIGTDSIVVKTPLPIGTTTTPEICLMTNNNTGTDFLTFQTYQYTITRGYVFSIDPIKAGEVSTMVTGINLRTQQGPDFNYIELNATKSMILNLNSNPSADFSKVGATIVTGDSDGVVVKSGKGYTINNILIFNNDGASPAGVVFSFIPPKITGVTVSNDSTTTTIQGSSFGDSSTQSLMKLGYDNGDISSSIQSIKSDTIIIKTPPNILTAGTRSFTIDLNNNTGSSFNYTLNPTVKTVSSVPTSGGTVIITGTHLNLTRGDGNLTVSTVTLGSKTCKNPVNNKDGSISCTIEGGSGGNHLVVVTIDGAPSSEQVMFSYGRPQMISYTQLDDVITVNGTSLGDQNTIVTINGTAQPATIVSVNPAGTELKFKLPHTARNGFFVIQSGNLQSNPNELAIEPVLKSVTLSDTVGSSITITGYFLKPVDFNNQPISPKSVDISPYGNCKDITFNDTEIICTAPEGAGTANPLTVVIGPKNSSIPLNYNKPNVTDYYQIRNTLYLTGTNFGKLGSAVQSPFNGKNLTAVQTESIPHQEASFQLSADDFNATKASITVQGQASNEIPIIIRPSVTNITPAPTQGGIVTVTGYFINTSNTSDIVFTVAGGVTCENITALSNSTESGFTCLVSNGYGIDHTIDISVANISKPSQDPSVNVTYIAPSIISATNTNEDGGLVTIAGDNFHPNSIEVKIGALACQSPVVTNYNNIVCTLPEWDFDALGEIPSELQKVEVTVGGQSSSNQIFKYDLEALYERRREEERKKKLRWMIPAIVVPCVVGIALIVAVSIILVKKHAKNQELKKMFGKQ